MAYLWKGHPIAAPITFESDRDVWTVEKLDKSIDRGASNAQRWKINFAVTVNQKEEDIFLLMATGMEEKHSMVMPSLNGVRERALKLNGSLPSETMIDLATSTVLNASNITVNSASNYTLPKGTFIRIGVEPKVYMVTADVALQSGSTSVIPVFPNIKRVSFSDTVVRTFDNVIFTYYLDDTMVQGITYSDGVLTGIDRIQTIEAI